MAGIAGLAGCGSVSRKNEPRPPAPITVTAAIHDDAVQVSPRSFGAGPVVLVIANESRSSQSVTFETDEQPGGPSGIRQTSTPIGPSATTQMQVTVTRGTYRVGVRDPAIRAAQVRVGAQRGSAQDALLQP